MKRLFEAKALEHIEQLIKPYTCKMLWISSPFHSDGIYGPDTIEYTWKLLSPSKANVSSSSKKASLLKQQNTLKLKDSGKDASEDKS